MHRRSGRLAVEEDFAPFTDRIGAEPFPKRVRARFADRWIVDTTEAMLAWIEGPTPDYALPSLAFADDVLRVGDRREHDRLGRVGEVRLVTEDRRVDPAGLLVDDPSPVAEALEGHVILAWNAVDAWFVEDERQRGHPRDPYHRIDVHESSREVRIELQGEVLAESARPVALFETGLPVRFYLPEVDVHTEKLVESPTVTRCAYKGDAAHFHARLEGGLREDVAWTYRSPEPGLGEIQDRICFYDERVTTIVDGEELDQPQTPFS